MARKNKYKTTLLSRFLLFLLFFLPLGYLAVSLAKGDDPLQIPRKVINYVKELSYKTDDNTQNSTITITQFEALQAENKKLRTDIEKCRGVVNELTTTN